MSSKGVKRKRDDGLLSKINASRYARSTFTIDPSREDLVFQLLECEDASKDKADADPSLIRLHGATESGHSIIVLVRGFRQFLYFPVSLSFESSDLAGLQEAIESNARTPLSISSTEIVSRQPLEFYRLNPEKYSRFVKITVDKPTDVTQIGNILGKSDELPKLLALFQSGKLYSTQAYETNLAFDMRMMTESGIVGCGWLKIAKQQYEALPNKSPYERVSGAFECQFPAVIGLSPDSTESDERKTKEYSKLASLRCLILSCIMLDGSSPKKSTASPSKPKSSKIKAKVKTTDTDDPEPFITTVSMVLTSSPLEGNPEDKTIVITHGRDTRSTLQHQPNLEVLCLRDEASMLMAFRDIFLAYDPDVVSGYDITSDALPSILSRGLDLGLNKDFVNLARCSNTSLKTKRRQIYSGAWIKKERKMAATSNREHTELGCVGRLVLDLRTVIEREERLRTYSLNESTMYITGMTLEKLSDTTLLELWHSDFDDDVARLLDYSLTEVGAALSIMRKHASLITYIELSRVTGLNFEDVVSRGQMRRFWSQLFRFCKSHNVVVTGKSRGGEQMTQSALNYMPETGYDSENPIIVLDFRSLYPSILIARNMCFSTELMPGDDSVDAKSLWTGFGGTRFVSSKVKVGIVPEILGHLLNERGRVKSLMKTATDSGVKTVLDGRQKAIKVCANAVYGFFGSRESNLQNLAIADGTITEGARLLEEAKQEIEKRYNVPDTKDAVKVVYGDTDSVFIRVLGKSVEEAIELGRRMSQELSSIWPDPIQLEFEKVLFPSLLQNRKRYAGLLWTDAKAPQTIDIKGIEVNRRDAVPLVGDLLEGVLEILFPFRDNTSDTGKISPEDRLQIIDKVKEYVKTHVGQILGGDLDIGKFILTKGLWLGTNASDYSAKQTHIAVIDKIRSRDSRRMFKDGERISYVYTQYAPNAKGYEKAEDPVYAINQRKLLDYQYYLDHTIINPLRRVLELFMNGKDIDPLFKPNKSSKTPLAKASGVMGAFLASAKKSSSRCEVCGGSCTSGKLCPEHKTQGPSLCEVKKERFVKLRDLQSAKYATCHSCQRSQRQILCVNMDCEVYFGRTRLDDEASTAQEDLNNFSKAEDISLAW